MAKKNHPPQMSESASNAETPQVDTSASQPEKAEPDIGQFNQLYEAVENLTDNELKIQVGNHLRKLIARHKVDEYLVLYLFDSESSINSFHSNRIYEAAAKGGGKQNILLVIQSAGGRIEPAYLISKTCKRLAREKFLVVVPRRAKSAATLLALGADEIHMGLMSELGPIDPQINGYPALGLTNALNKVAELAAKFPESGEMWSKYLGAKLDLNDLGYFDRVSESAAQYAERLMHGKNLPNGRTVSDTASHFVNHYKDHSFVIDYDEAAGILGTGVVKTDTPEYNFGNEVYGFLNLLELMLSAFKEKSFALFGAESGIDIRVKPKK